MFDARYTGHKTMQDTRHGGLESTQGTRHVRHNRKQGTRVPKPQGTQGTRVRRACNLADSTKSKITRDENGKILSYLEITEVVLIQRKIDNNNYQQNSRILCTNLVYICSLQVIWSIIRYYPLKFIFLKTFDQEFSYTEVWFTDQNSKPLQIEDKINIILVIN